MEIMGKLKVLPCNNTLPGTSMYIYLLKGLNSNETNTYIETQRKQTFNFQKHPALYNVPAMSLRRGM